MRRRNLALSCFGAGVLILGCAWPLAHPAQAQQGTNPAAPKVGDDATLAQATLAQATLAQATLAQATLAQATLAQATLAQIETYLNGLTGLTANFLQVAADGSTRTGKAWLQRPGKMRFEYDPPDRQLMVAGFGELVYYDPELDQTTNIPLSATPLGILLAKHVVLSGDVTVTAIDNEPGEIDLTLIRTGKAAAGSLTLVFGTDPLELRQWKVLDAQARVTQVSLYDVAPGGPFPDSLFTYIPPAPIPSGG